MDTNTQNGHLEDFVAQLLDEKGLGSLDDAVKEQMAADLLKRVHDRINATIIKHLPPEKLEEFEGMLKSSDAETLQNYCKEHIVNLDEVLAAELVRFRQTYLGK